MLPGHQESMQPGMAGRCQAAHMLRREVVVPEAFSKPHLGQSHLLSPRCQQGSARNAEDQVRADRQHVVAQKRLSRGVAKEKGAYCSLHITT